MREHHLPGGRELLLYGRVLHDEPPGETLPEEPPGVAPHLRWHPLQREWVAYSGSRQGRTFLPQAAACPLCPAREGKPGEIPFSSFEIAVFENRFPAFAASSVAPLLPGIETAPASGRCEVIVFSDDHVGGLGSFSLDRLALLIEVWGARISVLGEKFPYVLPFENRGEEIGVTLHHPHGQVYAFPFLPARAARAAEAQMEAPVISRLIDGIDPTLLLDDEAEALALVPPFATYPYETWIVPRRRVPGPQSLQPSEIEAMARLLRRSVRRLDLLFEKPMPYILIVQTAPRGFENSFHMTIEIRPFLRDRDKLKYLAGVEQGSGVFLVDVPPELAAERLRAVGGL
ncbi:galactose-1-phosphate uridylyltransferase [Parvibaculum lavamentivorans DS-1]|uniref:Galactose-1-phosphate uridylyltransferase n=1 Tax=Parvibaculum lavamentivorans (strain DS-1 / DSM 13023 / NCIMB 13966) TaxID=402881 RepID=A7HUG5_PARL1|nr:galactose-1-phosphate uridylyltransferase [Parvibaculum lavamentivorans]ABS63548.1 galactose-1-phosphate uridylyltransferase [Parvibaculum lavamentivorans DS-1]